MVQTTATPKTKSKSRYLKAKKERRKKRLKAATAAGNALSRLHAHGDSGSESSDDEADNPPETSLAEDVPEDRLLPQLPLEPPKKKRKESRNEREPSPLDHNGDDSMDIEPSQPLYRPTPPVELPTLPSFPLPSQPAPPSKAVLALQGLDQAILEAEIIDPTITTRIPAPNEPDLLGLGISRRMRERLVELGIDSLFAVQTVLLPFLLSRKDLHCRYDPPQDACVSAPTGSGKTLAYVVPITEILSTRIVTRLRALVVLPTRELAMQVRETFDIVSKGRGLKIAIATGQHSFAHEQSQLVLVSPPSAIHPSPQYHSKVDILICTPGRLTDHLHGTPGFTLEHLRFLVIDEADRLITQSFQDWLSHVLEAAQPPRSNFPTTELDEPYYSSCQKLLFSATLTHDPSKIVPLGLRDPRYFVIGDQTRVVTEEETFAFPTTLSEHMCVCSPADKPLFLFHLVHTHGVRNALIFTKSAESTTRLVQLFEFFESARNQGASGETKHVTIQAYSSDLSGQDRKNVIERFKEGKIDLLVCSDLVARGVDISHVAHVVSYDVPVDMRKYVHRVGRTARAGRRGDAWSLVEDQEARYFKQMLKKAGHLDAVKKLRVKEGEIAPLHTYYETALQNLKELPAKSLGIVSDSEGEEDRIGTTADDLFEREVNAARFSDPRDWHHNQPAAITTNLSSHISEPPSLPEQIPIMQIESSGIGDFDSSATKPRPRPRPRMRPVPPPDQPDSSSIGAFSTIPPNVSSAPETLASFDNSTVQAVPVARPPSLPPSSLPGADTASSSIPIPTFPTSVPLLESLQTPIHLGAPKTSSGDVPPPTETTSANPKRPRPKMRPPPPPEPDIGTTGLAVTASSTTATATSSADPHATASTGATSVSSTSKSDPSRSSALEEAEEYTGRGARRIAQTSKPTPELPPFLDHDIDVGGPEDNQVSDVIMLISSEDEYSGEYMTQFARYAQPYPKTKPKPKKKDVPRVDPTPAKPDNTDEQVPAPVKSTLKRKSAKLQSSDDEFGKWDSTIPGGSAPSGKHKKPGIPDSDAQSSVPNPTGLPKSDPTGGPGYRRATSSPLSSPGHSPELKRKSPLNVAAEESVAQSPTKKPRKSGFVGVVLTGPSNGNGKPPKRARKKTAKAAAAEDGEGGDTQAYIPPTLGSVENISTSILPSESNNTNDIPSHSSGSPTVAQEPETPPMDIDTTSNTKKESKKRAPKGKKGAANEGSVVESSAQDGPAPKEAKGKRKGKEPVSTMAKNDTGVDSSNPDADTVPGTSSNLGPDIGPQPVSSNSSAAPAPTPAAKPKPRPRHSTTPAPLPVAMGASGSLLRSASGKSTERPLSETLRLALGGTGSPAPRMGLSRRGSSKIAPLLAFRGAPPPPPPPMPKKPTKKKKGVSDDEDSEEGPEWEGLTEKQKEKKRREKEMAGWYSDG
ncbi:DEAD box helicase family, partial [Rhizoctonia solani]